MLENELKKIWQQASPEEIIKLDKSKLLVELDTELTRFNKGLIRRDKREIGVALFLIPFFLIAVIFIQGTLSKIALGLGIPYCILVIYVLKNVKKYQVSDFTIPLREFLIKQKNYLEKERALLDNILYWYILPPSVSTILFFYSRQMPQPKLYLFISVVVLVMAFIYYLNKKAVKDDFDPVIKRLDETIKKLEKEI